MNDVNQIFSDLRKNSSNVKASLAAERIAKLKKLRQAIFDSTNEIHRAIWNDFRKSDAETDLTEIYVVIAEINHALKHLSKWMRPHKVKTPFGMAGTKSRIMYEPKGTVLIIGPWNYPFALMLIPLVSAIASGNTVLLKPSELTPNTSRLIGELAEKVFSPSEVATVQGGPDVVQKVLELPFDHIFFTGSTRVGKIVAQAAAKNLTPVTLELGGKSPTIVDESANLDQAAQKIAWGKFVNAGQTCVAPDYLLVPHHLTTTFINSLKKHLAVFYGATDAEKIRSPDLCRIINQNNYSRLKTVFEQATKQGARVAEGGQFNDSERYISPTILTNVSADSPIMKEEIFGPILPVVSYDSMEEVYSIINSKEKPLSMYIYGRNKRNIEQILKRTTAGGTCVNNSLIHLANPFLPFGGVGPSGQGNYHGFFGFKAFSHERAVMAQPGFNAFKFFYPPYTPRVKKLIRLAVRYLT